MFCPLLLFLSRSIFYFVIVFVFLDSARKAKHGAEGQGQRNSTSGGPMVQVSISRSIKSSVHYSVADPGAKGLSPSPGLQKVVIKRWPPNMAAYISCFLPPPPFCNFWIRYCYSTIIYNYSAKICAKGFHIYGIYLLKFLLLIFCRDGKEMVATIKIKIVSKEDTHTLTVSNVTKKSTGVYRVLAKNKYGQAEHTANITVTGSLLNAFPWLLLL